MDLTAALTDFVRVLRSEHRFTIGEQQLHDAARALDAIGLRNRARVRAALRSVLCSSPEEITVFDRLFPVYFGARHPPRVKRATPRGAEEEAAQNVTATQRRAAEDDNQVRESWQALRARYSPDPGANAPPVIADAGLDAVFARVARFIAAVRLGRSRAWRPQLHGGRFDLRRTLRASLHTGGDPAVLRLLGHPHRNPRFVVLIDGSRSMQAYAAPMLQFAYALVRRSRRARAFFFSTKLREVTRELRGVTQQQRALPDLGEAWGGGTRIGANLHAFVRDHGAWLTRDTLVILSSDGLDVGEIPLLRNAMRELRRRSAAILWVNPHYDEPGFEPSAAGMRAALPSITTLAGLADLQAFDRVWRRTEARVGP